jgi:hypothetical protein
MNDGSDNSNNARRGGHLKRASVSFAEEDGSGGKSVLSAEDARARDMVVEQRRRERRRSEAKAAIEVREFVFFSPFCASYLTV